MNRQFLRTLSTVKTNPWFLKFLETLLHHKPIFYAQWFLSFIRNISATCPGVELTANQLLVTINSSKHSISKALAKLLKPVSCYALSSLCLIVHAILTQVDRIYKMNFSIHFIEFRDYLVSSHSMKTPQNVLPFLSIIPAWWHRAASKFVANLYAHNTWSKLRPSGFKGPRRLCLRYLSARRRKKPSSRKVTRELVEGSRFSLQVATHLGSNGFVIHQTLNSLTRNLCTRNSTFSTKSLVDTHERF